MPTIAWTEFGRAFTSLSAGSQCIIQRRILLDGCCWTRAWRNSLQWAIAFWRICCTSFCALCNAVRVCGMDGGRVIGADNCCWKHSMVACWVEQCCWQVRWHFRRETCIHAWDRIEEKGVGLGLQRQFSAEIISHVTSQSMDSHCLVAIDGSVLWRELRSSTLLNTLWLVSAW